MAPGEARIARWAQCAQLGQRRNGRRVLCPWNV